MRLHTVLVWTAAAGLLLAAAGDAASTEATWTRLTDGAWANPANWDPPTVPNGIGDVARLDVDLPAPLTIDLSQSVTLGQLHLADPAGQGMALFPAGAGFLTFNATGVESALLAGYGTLECQVPVTAADDLVFRNTPGEALDLTVSGTLSTWANKDLLIEGDQVTVTATNAAPGILGNVDVGPGANVFRLASLAEARNATLWRAHAGAVLELDNAADARADRIDAPVELWGGTLRLIGRAGSYVMEHVPQVSLYPGASVIEAQPADDPATGTTIINLSQLVGWYGGTVDFRGDVFGSTTRVLISEPGGPTLKDGLIGGFARVGPNWASYAASPTGVVPLTAYTLNNLFAGATANVLVNQNVASVGNLAINSLKLVSQPDVNLQGGTLYLDTGGLLVSDEDPPAAAGVADIRNGWLTAYPRATGASPELFVHLLEPLEIAAGIANNPIYPTTPLLLTASGTEHANAAAEHVLTLSGANTYTGDTTVASACISVDATNRLGHAANRLFLADGCLRATGTFATTRQVTVMSRGAFEIADAQTLTLNGVIGGSGLALYIRPAPGGGIVPGTVVFGATNTFQADLVVGPAPLPAAPAAGPDAQAALVEPTVYLQVQRDANFGDAASQTITLDGGGLHVTGTFDADPDRRFLMGPGGAWIRVDDGHVFTTGQAGQLAGGGTVTKTGDGKWAVDQANLDVAATHTVLTQGTLELRHPQAMAAVPIVLNGGTLSLFYDTDAAFQTPLVAVSTGKVRVHGQCTPDPVLSVPSLTIEDGAAITITGRDNYVFAVGGPTVCEADGQIRVEAETVFNGPLTVEAGGTLVKCGPDRLTVAGAQTHGVGAALHVTQGETILGTDAGPTLALWATNPGTTVMLDAAQHLASLRASGGAVFTTAPDLTTAVRTTNLLVDDVCDAGPCGLGVIDLANNNLIVDYDAASPYGQIEGWVTQGFNGGAWNSAGTAIGITTSAGDATDYALAIVDNTDGDGGGMAKLEGEPVDATSVLVKYTFYADADLNGTLDAADVNRLVLSFGGLLTDPTARWASCDYNYDNLVDAADVNLLVLAFASHAGKTLSGGDPVPVGGGVPTPEPATLALLGLGAAAMIARRRRTR